VPNCICYDPTFAYELAVIVQDGIRRMYQEQERVFYYVTAMNENYHHPAMPDGVEEGIRKGMYLFQQGAVEGENKGKDKAKTARKKAAKKSNDQNARVQLMGSGSILREVIAAADLLQDEFDVAANVWSVTSFTELRREGLDVEHWNLHHPQQTPKVSYVEQCLADQQGPVIAATDYMKAFADQIRAFVPQHYVVLGTDGFGRSDTREELRHFFEVDRYYVTVAALKALADEGTVDASRVSEAIKKFNIDTERLNPARA
jgi:pyruvate dehydrogenase E1 component